MARRLITRRSGSLWVVGLALVLLLAQQNGWLDSTKEVASSTQPGLYTITRFSDGDTFTINMNGTAETVRMIGIDTPETHRPNSPVQCYGPAASAFTKNFIGDKKVRLEADPKNTNRDRYDRLLRYVYLPDGTFVNLELVKRGYGFAYLSFPITKASDFAAAQTEAQQANRGLWGNCKPQQQANGRWQTQNM
jgi:endonuclease YncB( thermonuclease family)